MANAQDELKSTDNLPWHSMGEGAYFKLLRYSPETGVFSIMLRIDAGGTFMAHRHLAGAEFYMTKGRMDYVNGSAVPGDWGYEALGAVHEATTVEVDSELLFIGYGPLIFSDEQGNDTQVLDGALLAAIANGDVAPVKFTV